MILLSNMKLSTYLILTSSIVSGNVLLPSIDTFAAMAGSKPAFNNASKSCFSCIRSGYIWCSSKWNYQEHTVKTPAAETSDN